MAGIPQRRKTEAGAKLASGFSGVWEVRSKSRKLSPRKMQLKKSLLPSAASTTPGGLGGRWTALFLAITGYPGAAHVPPRAAPPPVRFPSPGVLSQSPPPLSSRSRSRGQSLYPRALSR